MFCDVETRADTDAEASGEAQIWADPVVKFVDIAEMSQLLGDSPNTMWLWETSTI